MLSVLLCFASGCGGERPALAPVSAALRPPAYDADFRQRWNDGASEVSSYETARLRQGTLRAGAATCIVKRAAYAEDERVPAQAVKNPQADVFPALQMNWVERYALERDDCEEMTTSVLALSSIEGRAPGTETKADFSSQSWDGQLFHQLLFDATGVRSHQYSYFENEGDEQITLAYPGDGVSGDALWFWARHMAAPAMKPGEQRTVFLLPALRDARSQHHALTWEKATLSRGAQPDSYRGRAAEVFSVHAGNGYAETFLVEPALPFHVLHWENSRGEHADLLSSSRTKSWAEVPAPGDSRVTP